MLLKQLRISLLQKRKYSSENTKIPANTNIPRMWSTVSQMLAGCRFSTANGVELGIIWFSIKILIFNSESFSKRAILFCEIPYVFFWCNRRNQSVSKLHFFRERVPGHFKIPHTTWAPLRKRDPKLSELWNFFSIKTFLSLSFAKRHLSRVHWYTVHGWLISPTKEDFCEKKKSNK